jgi:MFS family permease
MNMSSGGATETATPTDAMELTRLQEGKLVLPEERHLSSLNPNARPAVFRSTAQEIIFIIIATMSVSMPSFLQGTTLVISALIQRELHMTTAQLTWTTASSAYVYLLMQYFYLPFDTEALLTWLPATRLTSGSFLLLFGRSADMFGRRIQLLSSLFVFTVSALGTGFSDTPITLILLNAIMGLASASAIPSAQGVLGSIYDRPSKRKNYAFACFSAGNHLGFVFSSIFSGIAAHILGWRASFWLLAIIYLVVFVGACFVCPADDSSPPPMTLDLMKQFDFVAVVLATTGIGLLATGIRYERSTTFAILRFGCSLVLSYSIGPDAPDKWSTPYVIAFLVVGVVLMAAFVWWECRFEYPLMPISIWRDRDFCLVSQYPLLPKLADNS